MGHLWNQGIGAVRYQLCTFSCASISWTHVGEFFSILYLRKETDPATPLDMEKYGILEFSAWNREYLAQNSPKSMMAYAEVEFCLFRFQFHALLRSGEPLFPRWLLKLFAKVFFTIKKTYFYPKKVFWFTFIVKFFRANLTCDTHSQNSNPPWALKNMGDLVFHPEYIIIRQKIGQNPWWHMLRSTLVS